MIVSPALKKGAIEKETPARLFLWITYVKDWWTS